jgi:acyl-CoA thioester hydrolase
MSKNTEPHRIQIDNYPHRLNIETQFGDMDVHGHINNLAIGRYFESARARMQLGLFAGNKLFQRDADYAMMLVENNIRFLAECNFPDPVQVGSGLGKLGNSSYVFQHGLFQDGKCVSLCEAVMVLARDGKPVPIPDEVRSRMQTMLVSGAVV